MAKKRAPKDVDNKSHLVKGKIDYIEPEKLIPYEYNARKHQSEIDYLCNLIKMVGFPDAKAIEVDKNMVIINGHGRRLAAMKLGMEKVPYLVRDLPEEVARAYRIADNKISDLSGWDYDLLQMEYTDLKELDIPLDDLGFQDMGFTETFEDDDTETVVIEDDEVTTPIDTNTDVVSEETPVYKLGDHTIRVAAPEEIVKLLIEGGGYDVVCSDTHDFWEIISKWEDTTGGKKKKM